MTPARTDLAAPPRTATPRTSTTRTVARSGRPGRHERFAEPLGRRLEPVAAAVDERIRSAVRSPIVVAATAYVGITLVLLVVGWLLVRTPLGAPVRGWDEAVSRDLATGRSSGWTGYSDVGTSGANTAPIVIGTVVVSAVLAALRRWRDLLLVPLGLAVELATFLTVNLLVARDRPDVAQLGGEPATHSFPSGHVAATLVLWGGVAVLLGVGRWRTRYQVLAWALVAVPVVTVGFSRVYRGMHFTTDVLAGLVLGALALVASIVATRASWLGAQRTGAAREEVGR